MFVRRRRRQIVSGPSSPPPPPPAQTVRELGMFGGQFKIEDTDMEIPFLDLMNRARGVAIQSAGYGNYGFGPLRVQSLVRASNVVTVTLVDAPGHSAGSFTAITGQALVLHCIPDSSFDAEGVQVTVSTQTSFTYPNAGPNATANIAGTSDIAAALLSRVQLGIVGHPVADHRCIFANPAGGTTPDIAGTYQVTFPGSAPGSVSFTGCTTSGYSPGASSFQITVTDPAILTLEMNSVPTNGTYRNPLIIPVGQDQSGNTKLRPSFATHCGRGKVTRWMDGDKNNGNPVLKSWAWRPTINAGTALPAELQIDTCNEVNHHPWFVLPTFAANDYVSGLSNLVKTRLAGSLDAIFETAPNEPWNSATGFTQYFWLTALAKKDVNGIYHGNYGYNEISSLTKAGGVATVTLNHPVPAGYVNGLLVDAVFTDTDFNATNVAITVTGSNTFTYPVSAGTKTAANRDGQIFGNLGSVLLSGGNRNINFIRARYIGKMAYDRSQLVKAAFDGALGGRAKVVLMWQHVDFGPSGTIADTLAWLVAQYGPLANWCYAIGGAPYPRGSGTTNDQLRDAILAEVDTLYAPKMHSIKHLAVRHGVKAWLYEGGVDLVGVNAARTDAFFTATQMRTAQEYTLRKMYSRGADLFMAYTTGQREVGNDGSSSWGLGQTIASLLPLGSATAPKCQGIDDVVLIAPPAIDDPNQLPGTVAFMNVGANTIDSDDYTGNFFLNGYATLNSADAFVEKLFYAPSSGTRNITIYGKHYSGFGSANNALRIYLNGTLQGTHALFDDATDVTAGIAGGSASPTAFPLNVPTAGWHILKLRGPSGTQPDRIGVSRVTA